MHRLVRPTYRVAKQRRSSAPQSYAHLSEAPASRTRDTNLHSQQRLSQQRTNYPGKTDVASPTDAVRTAKASPPRHLLRLSHLLKRKLQETAMT